MTDAQILAALAAADGAILWWQVDELADWKSAQKRGVILFDEDTDCYVHPLAQDLGAQQGYTMRAAS